MFSRMNLVVALAANHDEIAGNVCPSMLVMFKVVELQDSWILA